MIAIQAKLTGDKKTEQLVATWPKAFQITLRRWMYAERRKYVGNKTKEGKFRRQLMRLRKGAGAPSLFRRAGNWARNVIRGFKGFFRQFGQSLNMTMTMGRKGTNNFMRGLQMMDISYSGSRNISSSNYMTLPVYANLRKRGINPSEFYKSKSSPKNQAYSIMRGNNIFARKVGDTIYWFDEDLKYKSGKRKGQPKRSALVFIGKKMIKIKPKFDFVRQWEGRKSQIIKDGEGRINRTVRALNKGYMRAE